MRSCLFVIGAFLLAAGAASAQAVVVVPKPGAGNWTVSYTRMFNKDDPSAAELSGIFRTLAAARLDAAKLQRWSASMTPGTDWKLRKIYIEGEEGEGGPPKDARPKLPNFFEAVGKKMEMDKAVNDSLRDLGIGRTETGKFAVGLLTDPGPAYLDKLSEKARAILTGKGLNDYKNNAADAYRRAKDLKEELMGMTGTLADKQFKKVNAAVEKYNREVANAPAGLGGVGRMFPKMTSVGRSTAKQVEEWQDALKEQFALEKKKAALDTLKGILDKERGQLEKEWKALPEDRRADPADPKVVRLRERLEEYQGKAEFYVRRLEAYQAVVERVSRVAEGMKGGKGATMTLASLVGRWGYSGDTSGREAFEIRADGTARAPVWYQHTWAHGRVAIRDGRIEMILNEPVSWAAREGNLKKVRFTLRLEGDKLVGERTWGKVGGSWDKPFSGTWVRLGAQK